MKSLKLSLLITILITNITNIFAQDADKAYLSVKYKSVIVNDTNKRDKPDNDIEALEIGKNGSYYYSVYFEDRAKEMAEWRRLNGDKMMDMKDMMKMMEKKGNPVKVYKNYKTNQVSYIDRIARDSFYYDEETPVFDWNIQPDTMRILNQVCQKATCTSRGRTFEAWYAQEINISEGPLKFNGLPGLILKISDTKKDYVFEAFSVEKVDAAITPKSSLVRNLKKEAFVRMYKNFVMNPMGNIMAESSSSITKDVPDNADGKAFLNAMAKFKFPYNPIELTEK
jgi:GLPGLI family protein